MENIVARYYEMYNKFCNGEITDQEWSDYCITALEDLMDVFSDTLKRLKEI